MLAIFDNDRFNRRQLPDLGAAQRRDIGQVGWQRRLTGRTLVGQELNGLMHLVSWDEGALVPIVTELSACWAPARGSRRPGRCRRRVGGRWFGGVARGLAELGLELAHQGFELAEPPTLGPHDIKQT